MKFFNWICCSSMLLLLSCTGTVEQEEFDNPAWVAENFYEAFLLNEFEKAAYYCDKSSKNSLEAYSYYASPDLDKSFVGVDSCDLYEDHAYCYCNYKDSDSVNQMDKLLLRHYGKIWKVHFTKGGFNNEASVLYDSKPKLNESAPDQISSLSPDKVNEVTNVVSEIVGFVNHENVIIPFYEESWLYDQDPQAYRENSYDNYFVKRMYHQHMNGVFKYYFEDTYLSTYEVGLTDFKDVDGYSVLNQLLNQLSVYYGKPYNVGSFSTEDWYKLTEVKWFLKGYNEELIVTGSSDYISIILQEAY